MNINSNLLQIFLSLSSGLCPTKFWVLSSSWSSSFAKKSSSFEFELKFEFEFAALLHVYEM